MRIIVPYPPGGSTDPTARHLGQWLSEKFGQPVVIDVAIDYAEKTYFTRGVVKTNLLRLPWSDRLRFIGRAVFRKLNP